jgi:hypothetical protein
VSIVFTAPLNHLNFNLRKPYPLYPLPLAKGKGNNIYGEGASPPLNPLNSWLRPLLNAHISIFSLLSKF